MSTPHLVLIGNVNVDMIMGPQAPWPQPGTEVVLPVYELRVGGQAGNAALALDALGVPLRLLANAGDDPLGTWLKQSFGAASAHWRLADRPTTVSVGITHPNGERTFFTNRGHLDAFGPEDVLPYLADRAPDRSVALLVGTFLSPRIVPALPRIIAALRGANYRIALDTGWPPEGWTEGVLSRFREWLAASDILLVNEAEARAIGEAAEFREAAGRLRALMRPDATLVVKRGPEGADGWRGTEAAHAATPVVQVVDSIGAGDIFNAGFLAAEMAGRPLAEAVRAGVDLASAIIATHPRCYRVRI